MPKILSRPNTHSIQVQVRITAAAILLSLSATYLTAAEQGGPLQLTLPKEFYAVVGQESNIYFDNVVLTQTPDQYQFKVECTLGTAEKQRWTITPKASAVGTHLLTLAVSDSGGKQLGRARTTLRIVPAAAGKGEKIRLLLVGDSLTHGTLYPNEIARLLDLPGNPAWQMLGTHTPKSAASGVAHEGYGGWTWQRFASKYEPNPDGTYRKRSSPFVYLGSDGEPQLNVKRYIDEACEGKHPDYVFFLLGINDCFSAKPDDPKAIDIRINTMFIHAHKVLAAFRKAAPQAELALCVTTPGNSRQAAFEANYKDRYTRWGWKRIQHRLVQRQLQLFTDREADQLFVVPTQLNLDPVTGYPENNGVHPNAAGYRQIGMSMFAWLKARLQAKAAE